MSTHTEAQYALVMALMRSVQMTIRSLDMAIGGLILALEGPAEDGPPAPVTPVDVEEDPDACDHMPLSDRVNNATMGHPSRFYCRKCKRNIE